MIIDVHAHVGDLSPRQDRIPVTFENLLARMDEEGIDRACVLPWTDAPEGFTFPMLFAAQPDVVSLIRATAQHPDRLIPFGLIDPRMGGNSARVDFSWVLERFVEMGCKGIGEVGANLWFDDPRVINMYRQCGQWGLVVTMESTGPGEGHYGQIDEPGCPRLERLLQEAPETIVIGHGPGFWADMGAGITPEEKSTYPKGPLKGEGAIWRLLRTYPNLYADTSATSGYNALTRDPAEGIRFLNEFQDKLLFGTDVCFGNDRYPHLGYLRGLVAEGQLSQETFDKVAYQNTLRILGGRQRG